MDTLVVLADGGEGTKGGAHSDEGAFLSIQLPYIDDKVLTIQLLEK
jgi:hypothetical protein